MEPSASTAIETLTNRHRRCCEFAGPLPPEELLIERARHRPGPLDQLAMTVWVVSESGSYTVRKETPASYPSSITPRPVACSQKPRP